MRPRSPHLCSPAARYEAAPAERKSAAQLMSLGKRSHEPAPLPSLLAGRNAPLARIHRVVGATSIHENSPKLLNKLETVDN